MTIKLETGKRYYDTTSAVVGPMRILNTLSDHSWGSNRMRGYRDDGTSDFNPTLIAEVIGQPTSPVRTVTTTRTEIVPGDYGRVRVKLGGSRHELWVAVIPRNPLNESTLCAMNADELDALAATATQLAAALRAIAAE